MTMGMTTREILKIKLEVGTLRSDIRLLQELPLASKPWTLLHTAHSGTCSAEPSVGNKIWLLCDLIDLTWQTVTRSVEHSLTPVKSSSHPILKRKFGRTYLLQVSFMKLCPFCSLVTCIQYWPLERLPWVATYSYPAQPLSLIWRKMFTGFHMICHPPQSGENKMYLKRKFLFDWITVLQGVWSSDPTHNQHPQPLGDHLK